jgi:hypothetical protein
LVTVTLTVEPVVSWPDHDGVRFWMPVTVDEWRAALDEMGLHHVQPPDHAWSVPCEEDGDMSGNISHSPGVKYEQSVSGWVRWRRGSVSHTDGI